MSTTREYGYKGMYAIVVKVIDSQERYDEGFDS